MPRIRFEPPNDRSACEMGAFGSKQEKSLSMVGGGSDACDVPKRPDRPGYRNVLRRAIGFSGGVALSLLWLSISRRRRAIISSGTV